MNPKDKLNYELINGNFFEAKFWASKLTDKEMFDCLMRIAFENQNILSYVFVTYLISIDNTAELHSLASDILGSPLCHLNGAYQGALFHARRALELDPNNIRYKEWILFFYEIPDRLVSREEAEKIASDILKENPSNWAAQKIFKL